MIEKLPPLSIYLHLPWCVQKCPYCDFNSHTAGTAAPKARYIAALRDDMQTEAARAAGRPVDSIFLGGGTPSLFSATEIGELLTALRETFRCKSTTEVTMEANPGTLERDRLVDYRQAGVNRLSLGAQSFDDGSLERLGRIHSAADIFNAFDDATRAGFDSINLDLMYALPGQTLEMALADLRAAIRLAPPHISWYQLTLEPNTVFHARPPPDLPDEDACAGIETDGYELLAKAGYEQYETSAFALPGYRCRHNLNYWQFGDYLAIGAGAHGKFTQADGSVWRYRKPAHPSSYMQASDTGFAGQDLRRVADEDLAFEFMLNAMRLTDGFGEDDFRQRTGLPLERVSGTLQQALGLGLVQAPEAGRWRPSDRGRRFQNDLQALFLPEAAGPDRRQAAARSRE
ncbi:MAG TPA: radical SAM family heme chaperone HemW [Woeseiaceae bacterium]